MKSKIAGVALAAVMACGWSAGAHAYTVPPIKSIDFSAPYDIANQLESFSVAFNSVGVGKGVFVNSRDDSIGPNFNYAYNSSNVTYSLTDLGYIGQDMGEVFSLAVTFKNVSVIAQEQYPGFPGSIPGNFTQYLTVEYFYDQSPVTFDEYVTDFSSTGSYYSHGQGSVSITLAPVPLQASAPLFAAGLLVLGGISYASRRGSAKVA